MSLDTPGSLLAERSQEAMDGVKGRGWDATKWVEGGVVMSEDRAGMFWDVRWSRSQGNERVRDVGQDRVECCGGE